jgi:hypothetical protein
VSPILDIQARFRELGRIRLGVKVDTGRTSQKTGRPILKPVKLPRFRLTSPWAHLIEQAANLFGGEARPWTNDGAEEYEVLVEVDAIPVAIPPGVDVLSQWYERWEGGGLVNRCDGYRQALVNRPCRCPADPVQRAEAAMRGDACKPTTRIRLMVPDLADVGIWRLETHGFHAAAELAGAAALIEGATRRGIIVPADLRLHAREGARRPGKPRTKFFVPALSLRAGLGETLEALGVDIAGDTPVAIGVEGRPALDAGGPPDLPTDPALDPRRAPLPDPPLPPPVEVLDPPSPSGDLGGTLEPGPPPPTEQRAAAPDTVPEPEAFDPPAPEPDPTDEPRFTPAQIIAMRLRERGVGDRAEKLAVVARMVGRPVTSAKDLTPAEARTVLDLLARPDYVLPSGPPSHHVEASTEETEPVASSGSPAPATGDALPVDLVDREQSPRDDTDPPFDPVDAPTWAADRWRAYLRTRGVKVTAAVAEATRLAGELDEHPVASLDDLPHRSASLVGLLCAHVEDLAEARKSTP